MKFTIQKLAIYLFLSFSCLIFSNASYAWGLDDLKDLGKQLENVGDINKATGNSKKKEPVTPAQETHQPSTAPEPVTSAQETSQASIAPEQAQPEKSVQAQGSSNFSYPWEFISLDMKPAGVEQLLQDWGYKQGKDCRVKIYEGTSYDGRYITCTFEGKWQGKWPSAIFINNKKKGAPDQLRSLGFTILYPDSFADEARENFIRFAPTESHSCNHRGKSYYQFDCFMVKDVELSASRGVDYYHDYVINFPNRVPGWQVVTYNTSRGSVVNAFNPNSKFIQRFAKSVR